MRKQSKPSDSSPTSDSYAGPASTDWKAGVRGSRKQEDTSQIILDALLDHIAVLDRHGTIIEVNRAWKKFGEDNGPTVLSRIGIGVNYLDVCKRSSDEGDELAGIAMRGIQEVLSLRQSRFSMEYPCHSPQEERWFLLSVTPTLTGDGGVVVAHHNITDRKLAEEALQQQHQLTETILNMVQTIVLALDTHGNILHYNRYLEEISGYQLNEVRGKSWFELFLPEREREQIRQVFARSIQGQQTRGHVNLIVSKSGQEYEIEWYDAPLTNGTGERIGIICSGQDITVRKQAEQALRENEYQLRAILNTAADAIVTIDERGIIKSVNLATEIMFGYSTDEMIGKNVSLLMPSPHHDHHDAYIARYLLTGEPHIIGTGRELVAVRKDGSMFPIDLSVSRVDQLGLFTGIIHDISRRKTLEKQVLEVAVEEQRRIGQELHDGTGQELTGLALFAGTLAAQLDELPKKTVDEKVAWTLEEEQLMQLRQTAYRLSQGLSEANKHVQQLSHGIMPVQVEPEGLRAALDQLASTTNAHLSLQCAFDCPVPVAVADNATATHLYRIAQEAVNNAMRHSQADKIRIALLQTEDTIVLEVSDNGIGFDPAATNRRRTQERPGGFGMEIMNYRAGMIGGSVRISRLDKGGMLVKCTVPKRIAHRD
jgi:PAS domain S-box-containing protein